jgi:hypothetical protein
MDYPCRERRYGRVRAGLYDMRLTPVGSSAPEWPGDDEFKPAIGIWLWSPFFGELRLETYEQDGNSLLWTPEQGHSGLLAELAADPGVHFVCFSGFDQAIWQHIMVERYGFSPIPVDRWIDTQAGGSYFALPRSLKKVLPVIGAPVVKDDAGRRLVLSLSRPNRKTGLYPELTPEVRERVGAYNRIDVAGTVYLYHTFGELPERERRVWELD